MECGFPTTLSPQREIKGRRGTYQVKHYLGARGWGRLYAGMRLSDAQPVVIKEYLLPNRCFNAEEARQRQETFVRIAGLSPADGRIQDFRLIQTLEAIADPRDERCYLITQQKDTALTLTHYLATYGAMNASQVRDVLNQTLQTLQFIHSQKFRRPSGQIDKGIAHGNLNLESVLFLADSAQFYVYLCDLAEWEFLFNPGFTSIPSQPAQDLVALGQLAINLWTGQSSNLTPESSLEQFNHHPLATEDLHLKSFLLRLLRVEAPFESAEAARQTLLQLPTGEQNSSHIADLAPEVPEHTTKKIGLTLLGLLAIFLLGGGLWYALKPKPSPSYPNVTYNELLKDFAGVSGLEPNRVTYISEQNGTWNFVLRYPLPGGTLQERLNKPQPNVEAYFDYQGIHSETNPSRNEAQSALFQAVEDGQAAFAITSLTNNLPEALEAIPIAYDGLLVFIPPNDTAQNLPEALNGQISLTDLRRLYTGEITNWQELGGRDLPVSLRIPTEPEAIHQFQTLVLNNDAGAIAQFRQRVEPQATVDTLRQMRDEFDANRSGIVSFSILSKIWDQCSGYPLAIRKEKGTAVQPLVQANGTPIQTTTDLCDKPSPQLDVQVFSSERYPLGYPLVVVYPKDNRRSAAGRKFAELLQTQQGQCLLHNVGLVPRQPVPEDCRP